MGKQRIEELEHYFKQFPDVPPEVILKEDLLRLGVSFSKAALDVGKGSPDTRGTLFTQIKVKPEELKEGFAEAPEEIQISGGPYKLRTTVIMNRLNPNSPYLIDVKDSKIVLCADGVSIAEGKFAPMPKVFL